MCTCFLVVVCTLCTTGDPGVGFGECGPTGVMQLFSPRNLAFFWVDAHLSPEGHIWGPPPPSSCVFPRPCTCVREVALVGRPMCCVSHSMGLVEGGGSFGAVPL
jgi:hypothetical protein